VLNRQPNALKNVDRSNSGAPFVPVDWEVDAMKCAKPVRGINNLSLLLAAEEGDGRVRFQVVGLETLTGGEHFGAALNKTLKGS